MTASAMTPLTARIPGSKSITNRALLLAAASMGRSRLQAPLVSDDTLAFRTALIELGVGIEVNDGVWQVEGIGGGPRNGARVWCADAGTAARFLPPFAATGEGEFDFDGSEQLRARPLAPLTEALSRLGAEVVAGPMSALPLTLKSRGLDGGHLVMDSGLSSQYLSGLLMAAPLMRRPLVVDIPRLVSRPYISMTLDMMRYFGADVDYSATRAEVRPGRYEATDLLIEPDASTASYFFGAAAVTGQSVTVPGLGRGSLQGDLRFAEVLRLMGAEVVITEDATTVTGGERLRGGFVVDMGDISDTFMTLAAMAPLADGPVAISGIAHARLKESDRITAVTENLRACGIRVEDGPDSITVHPGAPTSARIACHRDHRIAMSFSLLQLGSSALLPLDDPGCVTKTFPGFHAELQRLFPLYRPQNT